MLTVTLVQLNIYPLKIITTLVFSCFHIGKSIFYKSNPPRNASLSIFPRYGLQIF